ncbi:MAG: flagellar export chaperone FliS [Opitutus sp.]|jgi:flagellar protein FliS|nr:flagellar export chaperone FliS [Opitutus sp.]MCS6248319.1 flagellar export chaperone FliS [Opitutus sp.]MCS6273755.1 flagellar export chaperone FliS [Opitutus sp.]MCS6276154.1 flagellar export chaperone FliS [Opitutus sp.]MCS6301248.1 flagellar export chaperone FliS [Opitutus sp.]
MAYANPGARAYQTQSILTASPGQLVLLMYDGALRFMAQARAGFALPEDNPRRIETIHTALLRAQAILSELRANLDMEAGGDIAANLDRLYDYHLRRLFECNLRKDEAPLIEVETLVRTLRDAWAEMLRSNENRVA